MFWYHDSMRQFESGATRDTSNGKFDYHGFRHPLCEHSFAKYMHEHRIQPDGQLRDANNWWKGFPPGVAIQSLNRHVQDVNCIDAGLFVYEIQDGADKKREVYIHPLDPVPDKYHLVSMEEALNAVRFNADAMKLEILTLDKTK
jgi:hypothetical protein